MSIKVPLYLCGFFSVPASLVASTWGTLRDLEIYSFEGSSSMKAVIDYLVNEYSRTDHLIFSNIQAVGSNSGLERLLDGYADFALVSQDVTELAKKHQDKWHKRKLRTITLAKEAMMLLYKPPRNCSEELDITESNVKYIYSVFSGHRHKDVQRFDWSHLISGCSGKIIPWVKSSGPTRSGTAYAFVDNPVLKNQDQDWLKKVRENYGNDFQDIKYTSESNLLSWNSFVSNLVEGSMIYLPSSFVFTNMEEINENGVKIAKLNNKEINLSNFSKEVKKGGYEWGRTYNLIYSTEKFVKDETTIQSSSGNIENNNGTKKSNKQKFVKWILENLNNVKGMSLIPVEDQDKDETKSDQDLKKYGVPFLVSQTQEPQQLQTH
ncbi:hypothetical protein A6V39_02545 [Candidatus Mycoplasma haematobovis]|uniref:PBP domain-containing protein n=1 Tax=Candidatus Mycoplasma haematobovis TaxID=432608 RepID=A0A1A9QDW5_9MOLU|nr:phosphate ABC transporter substrate-binding protein [Candidatus Mycoplasma haematobovis]OAL10294.1 hypothetical protein A6V39_02545 [Candidatus Mycoplasma haematobovis]